MWEAVEEEEEDCSVCPPLHTHRELHSPSEVSSKLHTTSNKTNLTPAISTRFVCTNTHHTTERRGNFERGREEGESEGRERLRDQKDISRVGGGGLAREKASVLLKVVCPNGKHQHC